MVVRSASFIEATYPLKVMSLLMIARRRTAKVPTAAASEGVKKPCMIPPTTSTKMSRTQNISGRERILAFHAYR